MRRGYLCVPPYLLRDIKDLHLQNTYNMSICLQNFDNSCIEEVLMFIWCRFDTEPMQVKIEIIENPMSENLDRVLGRILIMMPAGLSTAKLDIRQASFNAEAVEAVPENAYDSDGLINLDELSTISQSVLDDLMKSIRYLGDANDEG